MPRQERRRLWLLSSVSDSGLAEQEVEIALERGLMGRPGARPPGAPPYPEEL